jgi:ribonuclease HI
MWYINTDGGARNNPGPAAVGIVVQKENGEVVARAGEYLGIATNNVAEYTAVVRALELMKGKGHTKEKIVFRLDSKLVVEQVQKNWKIKEETLRSLATTIWKHLEDFTDVTFIYVPRAENKAADTVVNEILDKHT